VPKQTDTLDRLAPRSRVAVIRLRSLGDCVLSTPAIHLLHSARPDLRIGVVVEDRFADVFADNPDVAEVLPPSFLALREFRPDLCLNLHGGTSSARLVFLSRAGLRAGFDIFRPGWIYNIPIPTAQETLGISRRVHTAEHMASAVFYLGAPVSEIPRARLFPPEGRSRHAPAGQYAVIHPFAATAEKTWPAASFHELAKKLDLEPVFIGAAGEDLSPFSEWRGVSGESVAEIARLMRGASLFVGNDSGPAHIAAAFGVPEVVFFGPSDSEVWAPWRTAAEVLKAEGPIASIPVAAALKAQALVCAP